MPLGDKSKEPAFKLWKAGRSLREIQMAVEAMSGTKPGSVAGWVSTGSEENREYGLRKCRRRLGMPVRRR
jgi:hypothetical protein